MAALPECARAFHRTALGDGICPLARSRLDTHRPRWASLWRSGSVGAGLDDVDERCAIAVRRLSRRPGGHRLVGALPVGSPARDLPATDDVQASMSGGNIDQDEE